MFWWKPGILIPDFVSLQYKIPTDINQNTVIKLQQNHIYFFYNFCRIFIIFHVYIYIYINNTKYNIYIYIILNGLGWAGPAQPTGPDSAQKVLGRFRPKMDWADLGPKKKLASPSGLGPKGKAGPGSTWPSNKTGGGNYFPPAPACRTLFVLHVEEKRKNKTQEWGRRRVTWRGGGGGAGVAAAAGGGAGAGAAGGGGIWLSDGGSGAAVSSREGGSSSSLVLRFLSLSFSPLSSSSLVFFPPFFLSFGSLFFLSPFSLFRFFFVLLYSPLFFCSFLLLSVPSPLRCCVGCYL